MEYWQTPPRKPSIGERLSGVVGEGLQQAGQMSQQSQQKEAIGKALGLEAQNLPPEMQKLAYQAKLAGENERAKKAIELQGVKDKQDYFKNRFGGQEQQKNNPLKITDDDILEAEMLQKGMGTQLRNLRNDAIKFQEAEEKKATEYEDRLREKNAVKNLLRETGEYDEEELENLSQYYDVPTARASKLQSKEKPVYEPTSQKLAAERTDKYINDVITKGTAAEEKLRSLEEGMTLHRQGATGFKLMNVLADYFDNPALADPGSKAFNAAMKSQYAGIGDIVKGKVSNFEFQTFEKRIATAADSPQAAEALMISAMMEAKIAQKEKEITERKREEYFEQGREPPANFDIEVRKELRPYADLVLAQTNKKLLDILNPTKKNSPDQKTLDRIWQ